jgi:hypothetical protein
MKIGGGYTCQLLPVTTLQGRNELEDFQIGMTWKSVLGLRRVKLDCEKQCFFYWWILAEFRFEKYDFTLSKGFFMEKKIQIRQIFMISSSS